MGRFNQAVRKGKDVDERIKNLVELKGAQMIGCEFCVDLGSQICRNSGFSDEELPPPPHLQRPVHRARKGGTGLHGAVMRTPVEVTDELFTQVRSYFDERQLVEITALLALVNVDRLQRGVRDRLGRLQRGTGVRHARPTGVGVEPAAELGSHLYRVGCHFHMAPVRARWEICATKSGFGGGSHGRGRLPRGAPAPGRRWSGRTAANHPLARRGEHLVPGVSQPIPVEISSSLGLAQENLAMARILFIASRAATLYASARVG